MTLAMARLVTGTDDCAPADRWRTPGVMGTMIALLPRRGLF